MKEYQQMEEEYSISLTEIVSYALAQTTPARRKPFVDLINWWAEHSGDKVAAHLAINEIREERVINANNLPKDFFRRYRQPDIAQQLIEIIQKIDGIITNKTENWTWAHVMKVMLDEGIIMKMTQNKFDGIISAMIPGKSPDTVRKSGDYSIIKKDDAWTSWTKNTLINQQEAQDRAICNMIAVEFQPILDRKILLDY